MTQNLDLDLSTIKTLAPQDTNIASDWTPAASTFIGDAKVSLAATEWSESYSAQAARSIDYGSYYPNDNYSSPNLDTAFTDIDCSIFENDGEKCHYHLGNHYNWLAAIATNDASTLSMDQQNVTTSICPKGWRLPTAYGDGVSTDGDFEILNNVYGGSQSSDAVLLASPLFFIRSGVVLSSGFKYVGPVYGDESDGDYWTNTKSNDDIWAYRLYFYNQFVGTSHIQVRGSGLSIRRIAQ